MNYVKRTRVEPDRGAGLGKAQGLRDFMGSIS